MLRAASNLMSGLSAFLQCLYAVPSFRQAILSYRAPQNHALASEDFKDYWRGDGGVGSIGLPMPVDEDRESRELRASCAPGFLFPARALTVCSPARARDRSHRPAAPLRTHDRDAPLVRARDRGRARLQPARERVCPAGRRLDAQAAGCVVELSRLLVLVRGATDDGADACGRSLARLQGCTSRSSMT